MLFDKVKLGSLELRNRIAMVAMATNLADSNGGVTQAMIDYYAERAKGGAGLIIVENAGIAPNGRNGAIQLRCDGLNYVPGLGRLADAVHYFGAKAIIQLQHAGQSTKKEYIGETPVGPCNVYDANGELVSRGLSKLEIEELVEKFANACVNAELAGFDGVEIHAAHSYLLAEFISNAANFRSDEYGGSIENRTRFAADVIKAVRAKVKPGFFISVRINGMETDKGGNSVEDAVQVARILEQAGADMINVSTGLKAHAGNLSSFTAEGWRVYLAEKVKQAVQIPVLCSGGLRRYDMMEEILVSGRADMIGVGRQFIADPAWPDKMKNGKEASIAYCLMCNVGCAGNRIHGKRSIQCAINPDVAREGAHMFAAFPATEKKRIAVVGAGPAGLTVAKEAVARGHEVHVWEKRSRPNGSMQMAAAVPGKHGLEGYCNYTAWVAENAGFTIEYGIEADYEKVAAFRPDAIIFCGGITPNRLDRVMDYSKGNVYTAHQFLEEGQTVSGKSVIVIGGGSVGCEVADLLAEQGNRVTVIEMTDAICNGTQQINRNALLARLKTQNVLILKNARLVGMEDGKILVDTKDGEQSLHADVYIVAAGGRGALPAWLDEFERNGVPCYTLGEARVGRPSTIMDAVHEATALGRRL